MDETERVQEARPEALFGDKSVIVVDEELQIAPADALRALAEETALPTGLVNSLAVARRQVIDLNEGAAGVEATGPQQRVSVTARTSFGA